MKNYKRIWNSLSTNMADATYHVGFMTDEEEIRRNGQLSAGFLREILQISPSDKALEIGCGVARIGRELAPSCGEWHGSDISGNMIAYARQRTQGVPNVYLHELPDSSLGIFNNGYFDCVYSSIVFMHLDKTEMFSYMREAYRVLAPGGRAYFDTCNILSPGAWQEFLTIIESFTPGQRPNHACQFSTPEEMRKFMEEAGFTSIHVDGNNVQLVVALGRKPEEEGFQRPSEAINPAALTHIQSSEESIVRVEDGVAHLPFAEWKRINENIAAKDAYIAELEATLATKDEHITGLEATIHKHDRMLRPLPVRVALRLSGDGTSKE
jgi:SAM-dependent methyltransferase